MGAAVRGAELAVDERPCRKYIAEPTRPLEYNLNPADRKFPEIQQSNAIAKIHFSIQVQLHTGTGKIIEQLRMVKDPDRLKQKNVEAIGE